MGDYGKIMNIAKRAYKLSNSAQKFTLLQARSELGSSSPKLRLIGVLTPSTSPMFLISVVATNCSPMDVV
jgi:hypothetical protein